MNQHCIYYAAKLLKHVGVLTILSTGKICLQHFTMSHCLNISWSWHENKSKKYLFFVDEDKEIRTVFVLTAKAQLYCYLRVLFLS